MPRDERKHAGCCGTRRTDDHHSDHRAAQKRHHLMIALIVVNIGIPALLLGGAVAPARVRPALLQVPAIAMTSSRPWSAVCCSPSDSYRAGDGRLHSGIGRSSSPKEYFHHLVVTGRSRGPSADSLECQQ